VAGSTREALFTADQPVGEFFCSDASGLDPFAGKVVQKNLRLTDKKAGRVGLTILSIGNQPLFSVFDNLLRCWFGLIILRRSFNLRLPGNSSIYLNELLERYRQLERWAWRPSFGPRPLSMTPSTTPYTCPPGPDPQV
jgi:hypothetical protein